MTQNRIFFFILAKWYSLDGSLLLLPVVTSVCLHSNKDSEAVVPGGSSVVSSPCARLVWLWSLQVMYGILSSLAVWREGLVTTSTVSLDVHTMYLRPALQIKRPRYLAAVNYSSTFFHGPVSP